MFAFESVDSAKLPISLVAAILFWYIDSRRRRGGYGALSWCSRSWSQVQLQLDADCQKKGYKRFCVEEDSSFAIIAADKDSLPYQGPIYLFCSCTKLATIMGLGEISGFR